MLNRLLPLNVVGPRGRARLLSGATSGGPRLRPRVGRLAVRGGAFLVSESCVTRCVRARAALRPFVVWRALPLNGRALGAPMLLSGCASGSRQRSVKAQVPAPPGPLNRQSERACSCSDHSFGMPSVLQPLANRKTASCRAPSEGVLRSHAPGGIRPRFKPRADKLGCMCSHIVTPTADRRRAHSCSHRCRHRTTQRS